MRGLDAVETVRVVGAGTMGSGIAQVAAEAGYGVVLRDVETGLVEAGVDRVADGLDRWVDNEALSDGEAAAARERVTGTTDLADLSIADFVVEDVDAKRAVFADRDDVTDDEVLLATNASTLSITTIAAGDLGTKTGRGFYEYN